jgi:hypothetical protein
LKYAQGDFRPTIAFGLIDSISPRDFVNRSFSMLCEPVFNPRDIATMVASNLFPLDGGCDCGLVRYRMKTQPLFVHCCHCRWCQRESGASFALNAMIEAERVVHLRAEPEIVDTPSNSGKGQKIARCPKCRVALWSNYASAGPVIKFVRVGTLDAPDYLPPDIHIFTASKQPWVALSAGVPTAPEYYERDSYWPPESLARRLAILPRIEAYQASLRTGAR